MTERVHSRATCRDPSRCAWPRLAAAVLAVGLLIGLAYYGEMGRRDPTRRSRHRRRSADRVARHAWINTRYFASAHHATRAHRPSGHPASAREATSSIASSSGGHLGTALSASEAERAQAGRDRRQRDFAKRRRCSPAVVRDTLAQLDEVRLPLHILLETRFGELNENQEELLRDARNGADAMDVALRRLAQVADADRGAPVQHELVQVNDVVRAVLPLARAAAERNGARTDTALEPGLPRVVGRPGASGRGAHAPRHCRGRAVRQEHAAGRVDSARGKPSDHPNRTTGRDRHGWCSSVFWRGISGSCGRR